MIYRLEGPIRSTAYHRDMCSNVQSQGWRMPCIFSQDHNRKEKKRKKECVSIPIEEKWFLLFFFSFNIKMDLGFLFKRATVTPTHTRIESTKPAASNADHI